MTDDEVIADLRDASRSLVPVEVAERLERCLEKDLTQSAMVFYFKGAFPDIPLRVLLDAGGWGRLSDGGLSDADFNELLGEWIGPGLA